MRFRSLIRKSVKPLAMAAVAGGVAVSLVVTTPSNAQAFVAAPIVPVVAAATEMAIPSLMATSSILGPVGWGIAGATVIGIGIYATRDYWLPYVTGLWGSSENNHTQTPPGGWARAEIPKKPGLSEDKKTLSVYYVHKTLYGQQYYQHFGVLAHCKDPVSGKTGYRHTGGYVSVSANREFSYAYNAVPCPVGYEITGWIASGGNGSALGTYTPNLNTSDPNPAQFDALSSQYSYRAADVWRGGDMGKSEFDPKSPETKYRVEAECIAPDGTKSMVNAFSTGDQAGITFPSCEAAGKGHGTGKVTVWATPPGTQTEENIWSATAPATDPNMPLCDPKRAGSGCKLAVQLDGKECVMGLFACENWAELSKDPNWTPRFSCQYGPYAVPLETCNPLERGYEQGGAPATEENIDGDPSTRNDKQPDGSTAPKTSPKTSTEPGGSGAPAPAPAPTGSPEATAQECWPSGWASFNPLEWILKPLGCAFIPKKDIRKESNELTEKAMTKAPLSLVAAIGATAPASVGGQGACPNWVVNIGSDAGGMNSNYSKNVVCDSSFIQAIVNARPALFALISGAMLWPFLRSLWYSLIPVVRVIPTGGK